MACGTKEMQWRLQGMIYACEFAQKNGIEALSKEIKRRSLTKIPMHISQSEADRIWKELSANVYNNVTSAFLYAFKEELGMSVEDLKRGIEAYQKVVGDCLDMDYLGEHYIKLEDYAVEISKELGIDLDIERIAACQDHYDENAAESHYHMAKVERIIDLLEKNNYLAAVNFLRNRIDSI